MSCKVYPNGFITVRKLEKMIDDSDNWEVFAKNKITNEEFTLKDRDDLREYAFYNDYSIGYGFKGDWEEYTSVKNKNNVLYNWKFNNIQILVTKENDKITAEILKWENNKPSSEDLPTNFVIAYWNIDDLIFVGDRFFKYIPMWMFPIVWFKIKIVQKIIEKEGV